MITLLEVNNFRNISSISLELNNITVLVGKNDIGKTNLLELIHILSIPSDLARLTFLNSRRVASRPENSLKFFFRNAENHKQVVKGRVKTSYTSFDFEYELKSSSNFDSDSTNFEFTGKVRDKLFRLTPYIVSERPMHFPLPPGVSVKTSRVELRQTPPPDSPEYVSFFIDNTLDALAGGLEKILSSIIEKGKKEELIEEQNRILPFKLKDIMIVTTQGIDVYIQREQSIPLPLSLYGAGTRFILKLSAVCTYLSEYSSELSKVILIDEIENGLHYSVKPKIWEFIFSKSKEFQFIITTHDEEFFWAIFEVLNDKTVNPENFSAVRIDKEEKDGLEVFIPKYYDLELLQYGMESGWEIRG